MGTASIPSGHSAVVIACEVGAVGGFITGAAANFLVHTIDTAGGSCNDENAAGTIVNIVGSVVVAVVAVVSVSSGFSVVAAAEVGFCSLTSAMITWGEADSAFSMVKGIDRCDRRLVARENDGLVGFYDRVTF